MFSRLFNRRKKISSASIAKERLQIIVAHERIKNSRKNPDFLTDLQKDILAVVRKYIPVDSEQIKVAMDQEDGCDVLELNIILSDISDIPEEFSQDGEANKENGQIVTPDELMDPETVEHSASDSGQVNSDEPVVLDNLTDAEETIKTTGIQS